ncbi:hypothetical protein B5M09_003386 [Aphanomyces astaci]|uniref:LTD domain-containing protein n=1 Tax=Aphanomyces astaci TaxID=112090 RepID=A0A425CRK8_APHAT|nr:hypothetical protein B5M09_003386 [Aphanomyces astaci]
MPYASLRRVLLPQVDRRVMRSTMQIYSATAMQQLYISRVDTKQQWIVVSNPSTKYVDLTHHRLTNDAGTVVFHFPKGYILQSGEEVTVWCTPGSSDFNSHNLLDPYLLWTSLDGRLSSSPFFVKAQPLHEVILLDAYLTEVASLQVTSTGQKTFRVNSASPQPLSYPYLNPFHFQQRHGVYVFSRYWGVVSDPAYAAHFAAVFICPVVCLLIEVARILLMYSVLAQVYLKPTDLNPFYLPLAFLCDLLARSASLSIKDGHLATFLSFSSFLVDQFHLLAVYLSLMALFPSMHSVYSALLSAEFALNLVSLAGPPAHFFTTRHQWHQVYRWSEAVLYSSPTVVSTCFVAKEAFFFLLHVKASPHVMASVSPLLLHLVLYACIPCVVLATAMTLARGTAIAVHLLTLRRQKERQS